MKKYIIIFVIALLAIYIPSIIFEKINAIGRGDHVNITEVEKRIIAIQVEFDKQENDESIAPPLAGSCDVNTATQNKITKIIVHHTATEGNTDDTYEAISRSHKTRWIRGIDMYGLSGDFIDKVVTPNGHYMMYHRLIGRDGKVVGDRRDNQIGRGTMENNCGVYHIAMVGNFSNKAPTQAQYDALNREIQAIRERQGNPYIPVSGHGQNTGEHTQCPGKIFDYSKIITKLYIATPEEKAQIPAAIPAPVNKPAVKDKDGYITFSLSRYYSPVVGQSRYYKGRTYLEDVKMNCGLNKDGTPGDCLHPASGKKYSDDNKNNSVACPSKYPIGTKILLNIDGNEHIVKCEDRGSAIVDNRLDMYCGIGERALDNWNTCITGTRKGKVL